MHKRISLLLVLTLTVSAYTGLPAISRNADTAVYIGFNNKVYGFSLPALASTYTYATDASTTFSSPTTFSNGVVSLSDISEDGSYTLNVTTNEFKFNPSSGIPYNGDGQPYSSNESAQDEAGNVYSYDFSGAQSFIKKTTNNGNSQILALPKSYNSKGVIVYQSGVLYLTATVNSQRTNSGYDYYAVDTSSFTIVDGPVSLPNTANIGCPVGPRQCSFTLNYLSIYNGVVVYVYSKSGQQGAPFTVTVNTYKKSCGFASNTFSDISAPAPTATGGCAVSTPVTSTSTTSSTPSTTTSNDNSDPDSTCPPNGCGAGLKCCSGQCYPAEYFTCFTKTDGSKQLCHNPTLLCGSACYDPSSYNCTNDQLAQN